MIEPGAIQKAGEAEIEEPETMKVKAEDEKRTGGSHIKIHDICQSDLDRMAVNNLAEVHEAEEAVRVSSDL